MLQIILFIYGIVIGSYLNVVVYKYISNEKSSRARSKCPNCNHKLSYLDLIPVFGYLVLGGKCRYCKEKISLQYPLVELAGGFVFLLVGSHINMISIDLFITLAFFALLLTIFIIDLKIMIIPDKYVIMTALLAIIHQLLINPITLDTFLNMLIGALSISGALMIIYLIGLFGFNKEVLGLGDVKLYISIGLFLGFPSVGLSFLITVLIGGIVAIFILIACRHKKEPKEMPLGPFICLATLIVYLYGPQIIDMYIGLFI